MDCAADSHSRLYCNNLKSDLRVEDLKRNLYMLFAPYGVILDIVALGDNKRRGQAHIVFRDIEASTQAMRALQDFKFFGKPMVRTTHIVSRTSPLIWLQRIQYAKDKSKVLKKLKGEYEVASGTEVATTEKPNTLQEEVFGSGPAPTKAKPLNAPSAPAAPEPAVDETAKGTKRTRPEEDEGGSDDEEAEMDVSDSD